MDISKLNNIDKTTLQETFKCIFGVILLFTCSQIFIPLNPVPITFQTVGVISIALLYNLRTAIMSYSIYLTIGIMGAPVFANFGFGITRLTGPTFGYLIGFFAAIYFISKLKEKIGTSSFAKIFILNIMGTAIIYICGLTYLSMIYNFKTALIVGFLPFIIPGIIKSTALAYIIKATKILK